MVSGQLINDDDSYYCNRAHLFLLFCCRRGTLLSARPANNNTKKSADVSPSDGRSNIHPDGGTNRSTAINRSAIISAVGSSINCHTNINTIIGIAISGTNGSTISGTNGSTISSAIGSSNDSHITNKSADVSPTDGRSNFHSDEGTNRSTAINGSAIISADGRSNNCHTNINTIIGFTISGTNGSTFSGTNESTISSAIGSSNDSHINLNTISSAFGGTNEGTFGTSNIGSNRSTVN
jgi:hypothetical protein